LRTTTAQEVATAPGGEPTDGADPGLPTDDTDTDDEGETEA
jgi:hypothetical protein